MASKWDQKLAEVANKTGSWRIRIGSKELESWMASRYDWDENGNEVPLPEVREYKASLDGNCGYFRSLRDARAYLKV